MYGSGAVSCSCSLLIRGPNLARCQAEAPLIALCRFPKPALGKAIRISSSLKGRKVPPKYRSRSGETWAGRGAKPRWLVAAMKKGRKMEDFLIRRRKG